MGQHDRWTWEVCKFSKQPSHYKGGESKSHGYKSGISHFPLLPTYGYEPTNSLVTSVILEMLNTIISALYWLPLQMHFLKDLTTWEKPEKKKEAEAKGTVYRMSQLPDYRRWMGKRSLHTLLILSSLLSIPIVRLISPNISKIHRGRINIGIKLHPHISSSPRNSLLVCLHSPLHKTVSFFHC